jgi:hypothetical protein
MENHYHLLIDTPEGNLSNANKIDPLTTLS